jgi:LacI family transcriptional regulator
MSTSPSGSAPKVRATIRDVAALAGVGTKTVSRVINEEPNVSPATRARVERAVSALNFKPNQGAGALRRGDRKTLTLGLLLDALDNPFSALINRAVETCGLWS